MLSSIWAISLILSFARNCFYFNDSSVFSPICETGSLSGGYPVAANLTGFTAIDWLKMIIRLGGPPFLLFLFGAGMIWTLKGFRRSNDTN